MIDLVTSNEIVTQRAFGLSFQAISEVVRVSKPTVIEVCRSRIDDIEEAKDTFSVISKEEISRAINRRGRAYIKLIYRAVDELQERDLSKMTTTELLRLINSTERALGGLEMKHETIVASSQPRSLVEFVGDDLPDYLQDKND